MAVIASLLLLLLPAAPPGPPVQVLLLDGSRRAGRIEGIAEGRLRLREEGRPVRTIPLAAIDRLGLAEESPAEPAGPCLYLSRRDALPVTGFGPAPEGGLAFSRPGGGGRIALERLHAFRHGGESADFARDLAAPRPDRRDFLYLRKAGKVIKVAGVITGLEEGILRFDFAGKERRIPFSRIYGAILAGGGRTAAQAGSAPCRLHFRAGGSLAGRVLSAGPGTLRFVHPRTGPLAWRWSAVAVLECARDRVLDLSRAEPASLVSRGALGGEPPLRRNRTVDGNPLRIAGREFDRGIGLIPYHRISYDVPPGFTHFHAFLGIADETAGAGAARCRILAGGQEIFRGLLRGGEKARELRLPLAGAATLVLEFDFGPRLHLGDHCVIAAPRLLALPEED